MHQLRAIISQFIFGTIKRVGKQSWVAPVFCRVNRFLPLQYIERTEFAIAIKHPRAGWDGHVVITPLTPCRGLLSQREPLMNRGFNMWQIYLLAREVAKSQAEDERGTFLIINGGRRQEIGQMHGHLTPTLGTAGFPDNVLEALEERIDERRFYNVAASPEGFTEWLIDLEQIAPTWLANDRGFAVLIPIEEGVLPVVKITIDCDI